MKLKISSLNYQRNGTRGTGFYSCILRNVFEKSDTFLATFESNDQDTIISKSCRVVNTMALFTSYDGEALADRIAERLKFHFHKISKKHNTDAGIYSLIRRDLD